MTNRAAFIDFAQGLLNLNPLERWTPAQAKLHPFITQAKYTGPFVPPMTLKSGSSRSPAPGIQEQQRFEGMSRQRQQQQQQVIAAQQAQAQAAQNAAFANMQMNQYAAQPAHPQPSMYNNNNNNNNNNMYPPNHQGAPPPYPAQAAAPYAQQMPMMQPQQPRQYNQPQNLYAQATTRAGRQRASTMDQQQGPTGIPPALQRVISHLDPNAPIRSQPSPAYYPPPPDGAPESASSARRRGSRTGNSTRNNQNFVRNLEDRSLEEGFMAQNHWQ
jgi:dual specificity protein kinase YAK1